MNMTLCESPKPLLKRTIFPESSCREVPSFAVLNIRFERGFDADAFWLLGFVAIFYFSFELFGPFETSGLERAPKRFAVEGSGGPQITPAPLADAVFSEFALRPVASIDRKH